MRTAKGRRSDGIGRRDLLRGVVALGGGLMMAACSAAAVPVSTAAQSVLMGKGLMDDFRRAGLDPAKIVANGGGAMNFGGAAKHGAMTAHLVPAVHSTLHAFPAAGFILEIGGLRVY